MGTAGVTSFDEVASDLGLTAWHEPWRASFAASEPLLDDPEPLPRGTALRAACREIRVPDVFVEPLVAAAEETARRPSLLRLLAHGRWMLRHEVPRLGNWLVPWGSLPVELGLAGRLFHPLVFLADLPRARRGHEALGVPEEVSIHTLSDLGLHLRHYHRMYGRFGFEEAAWESLHFTGRIFRLGRLQFEMGSWRVPVAPQERCPLAPGSALLDLHITDDGPLDFDACEESIARARAFFPRHFPDFRFEAMGCWSWLLDPQLEDYLPESSNIRRFQSRFRRVKTAERHDGQAVKFVFRPHPDTPLDALPQNTSLQRAIVSHVRAGRDWDCCLGYF